MLDCGDRRCVERHCNLSTSPPHPPATISNITTFTTIINTLGEKWCEIRSEINRDGLHLEHELNREIMLANNQYSLLCHKCECERAHSC